MDIRLHAKCNFCQILTENGIFRQIFVKIPSIRLHKNPSPGSRVVPSKQMKGQTTTVITVSKLFADASTKRSTPCYESH